MYGSPIAMRLIQGPHPLIEGAILFNTGPPSLAVAFVVASLIGATICVLIRSEYRVVIGILDLHLVLIEFVHEFLVPLGDEGLHLGHLRKLFADQLVWGV